MPVWDPALALERTYEIALEFVRAGTPLGRVCSQRIAAVPDDALATPEAWRAHLIHYAYSPLVTPERADREVRRIQGLAVEHEERPPSRTSWERLAGLGDVD